MTGTTPNKRNELDVKIQAPHRSVCIKQDFLSQPTD